MGKYSDALFNGAAQAATDGQAPEAGDAPGVQYAKPGPYVTNLKPQEEAAFRQWVKANHVPWQDDPHADYDMRGYFKALESGDPNARQTLNDNDGKMHFPDTYKTPFHKSFSRESKYATPDAPEWNDKDQLIAQDGRIVFDERAGPSQSPQPERTHYGEPRPGKYSSRLLGPDQTSYSGALADNPTGRVTDPAFQQPASGGGAGFAGNLKAGMVEDPNTKLQLLAKSMFPNDPKAVERFGWRDNRPVFVNNSGKLEYADSGVGSGAGRMLSNVPEMVGGAVGTLATGNPFAGAVVGSVGGKGVKQILSGLLFDEPQTTTGNTAGLAQEGATAAFGAGLGKAGSMAFNRAAVRNADKFDLPAAQATIKRIEDSTGIKLDFAQAANIRQLRDLKKWAGRYPSDAQEIVDALDQKQADQVASAIQDRLLNRISKTEDVGQMANSGILGARNAITLAKQKRAIETRPLFAEAEKEQLPGDVVGALKGDPYIASNLKAVLNNDLYGGEFKQMGLYPHAKPQSALSSPLPLEGQPSHGASENSVKAWDLVLRNMKDAQRAATVAGENNKARLIGQKADTLEQQLSRVSPKYAEARQAWAKATQEYVSPLEDGMVGVIAKTNNPNVAKGVAQIMSGDILTNPATAAKVRGELLSSGNEQSWNDLVRLSLTKAFEKAAKETQGGDVVNMAGKFRQSVAGTPQQKLALNVAVGKAVHPQLDDILDALQMIARENRGRGGSDTAWNQAITQQQKGGALSSAVKTATAPLQAVRDSIDSKFLERNASAIAEALTDPAKLVRLKELRKLKPSQERAIATLSVVGLGKFGLGGAADALTLQPDAEPETLQGTQ